MSRVDLLQSLYATKENPFKFDFDALTAPRIYEAFSPTDIGDLNYIATSLKYNGKIGKKKKMIDEIMKRRGFKWTHDGTNRMVYDWLDVPTVVAKIALDKVGIEDTPKEYVNQQYIKPYCCKVFEVAGNGVMGFIEKVNPITSIYEYLSVASDIYDLYLKLTGIKILDDIGTDRYLNIGIRANNVTGQYFGPVVLDFPYLFKVDGKKLKCKAINIVNGKPEICNGDIDIDIGFNKIYCTKCGRDLQMQDIASDIEQEPRKFYKFKEGTNMARANIIDGNGNIILASGRSSKILINPEEYRTTEQIEAGVHEVSKTIKIRRTDMNAFRQKMVDDARMRYFSMLQTMEEARHKELGQDIVESIIEKNRPTVIKPVPYVVDTEEPPVRVEEVYDTVDIYKAQEVAIPEYDFNKDLVKAINEIIEETKEPKHFEATEEDFRELEEEQRKAREDSKNLEDSKDEVTEEISESEADEDKSHDDIYEKSGSPVGEFMDKVSSEILEESLKEDAEKSLSGESVLNEPVDESISVNVEEPSEDMTEQEINNKNAYSIANSIIAMNMDMSIIKELYYMSNPDEYIDADKYQNELDIIYLIKDYKVDLTLIEYHLNNLSLEAQNTSSQDDEISKNVDNKSLDNRDSDGILKDY